MSAEGKCVLSVKDLNIGYDKKKPPVISGIDIDIMEGETVVLLGPNGTGKSTFLYTVSGLLERLSGEIKLYGRDISEMSAENIALNVSVVLTKRPGSRWMSVKDMVETGRYPYTDRTGRLKDSDKEIVSQIMDEFGLKELSDELFCKLSDGQKQRVMIAKAVCQTPKLLIMDEPTGFLDIKYRYEIGELIRRQAKERNIAVLVSMHELDTAKRTADRVLCFKDGKTEYLGDNEGAFDEEHISRLFDIGDL